MRSRLSWAFAVGTAVGVLGGLIGLGGAEFRLPLLIGMFGFEALPAVILNKAMSLVVVASALPSRMGSISLQDILEQWPIVLNLLAGSLAGAWVGASWAVGLRNQRFHLVIAVLLLGMAVALLAGHGIGSAGKAALQGVSLVAAGLVCGFAIGAVASLLGVAGGELLIPTLILLFGVDVKLAGSLSLVVSLPTMVVAFARYSRDKSFVVIGQHAGFGFTMAAGSIAGTFIGGQLLRIVDAAVLVPLLAAILAVSAFKMWRQSGRLS